MHKITKQTEIEAAAFRRLLAHLDKRKDVQNIDYEQAREHIYGMPYREREEKYQTLATAEQLQKMQQQQ